MMLTQQLEAIRPQLFELRRRVVELEEENRQLEARSGDIVGISGAQIVAVFA